MTPKQPDFNSIELCSIIRECAASNVSSLLVGGVKIDFYSKSPPSTQVEGVTVSSGQHQPLDQLETEKLVAIIDTQSQRLELMRRQQEEQELLPILDPEAWEESETNNAWKTDING